MTPKHPSPNLPIQKMNENVVYLAWWICFKDGMFVKLGLFTQNFSVPKRLQCKHVHLYGWG